MKSLFRNFLINLGAIWAVSQIIPSFVISGGFRGLMIGVVAFMVANWLLVPMLKILLLPLNLITLGVFAWLSNVLVLYFLVNVVPSFKILPFYFPGLNWDGFVIPSLDLSTFQVTIVASFIIGSIIHVIGWLRK